MVLPSSSGLALNPIHLNWLVDLTPLSILHKSAAYTDLDVIIWVGYGIVSHYKCLWLLSAMLWLILTAKTTLIVPFGGFALVAASASLPSGA